MVIAPDQQITVGRHPVSRVVSRSQSARWRPSVTQALRAARVNHHGWPASYLSLGARVSAGQAQPGDLVYYANGGMGFAHIAICIGGGKAVHGGWNGNQTVIQTVNVGSGPVCIRVH
ncbi:NlpC/P60 family protein [Kocuria sp. CPCC 205236]